MALMAALSFCGGCGEATSGAGGGGAPPFPGAQAPPFPGPGGPGAAEPLGDSPTVKQIMGRLARGPGSLTPVIGQELEADPPDWGTIRPQAQEFARLALAMGKNEPPKGDKESWAKLTSAYAETAEELDRAAEAKDRDAARAAHGELRNSCNACHRAHRPMGRGPGMGGPGFGPPGMGPPGGPPPGGPGGGPPGGPPPR